ncbi:hypothetical protein MTR_4g010810 [Medicago truncatula]|uniref:Uncharacterized protein n=1 Tax=Medicago truncatula TaxID=3880 RepID=A0A072US25_MEDTR|nr:hypothetical protein MTR_4g010810 [Medicago truncatula]
MEYHLHETETHTQSTGGRGYLLQVTILGPQLLGPLGVNDRILDFEGQNPVRSPFLGSHGP